MCNLDTIKYEHEVLKYLANQDFPCIAPITNVKGKTVSEYNQYQYALFPFVGGETDIQDIEIGTQSATLLGNCHNIMESYP